MMKVVNIYPVYPITTTNPPIRSTVRRVTKSPAEIRACLMARARVEEVLPNGNVVTLTLSNYDKDNNPAPKVEKKDVTPVTPPPVAESTVEEKKHEFDRSQNNNYGGGKNKNKHNHGNFNNNRYNNAPKQETAQDDHKSDIDETKTETKVEQPAAVTESGAVIETMDLEELGL